MTRKHNQRSKTSTMKQAAQRASKRTPKVAYRVRNWADYNQSLVKRGSMTLWISDDVLSAWQPRVTGPRQRGGQPQYTDGAIECLLMIKAIYHLTLRATEGFAQSLRQLLQVEVPIPDYSTLSRRASTLRVALPTTAKGPIHAVLDSTGLKIYGEGEWKVRQHGYSKRRTWRRLHLSVDEATGEIQAEVLIEASVDDAEVAGVLMEQTPAEIKQVSADGAYDKEKVYTAARDQGVSKVAIPPRRDAHIWQHGNCAAPPHARDGNLRRIREVGRKQWKEESGYHRRSLAETTMFRFKTLFGDHLSARELARQKTEARIKCAALNRMTGVGMPESYRVI
jgi:hypothetical protein